MIKSIVEAKNPRYKGTYEIEWHDAAVFSKLKPITQVYGILFNEKGEILIVHPVDEWSLPGGKPEPGESYEKL